MAKKRTPRRKKHPRKQKVRIGTNGQWTLVMRRPARAKPNARFDIDIERRGPEEVLGSHPLRYQGKQARQESIHDDPEVLDTLQGFPVQTGGLKAVALVAEGNPFLEEDFIALAFAAYTLGMKAGIRKKRTVQKPSRKKVRR